MKAIIENLYLIPFLPMLLVALISIKGILFLKSKTRSWRLAHFVYFDDKHIISSSNLHTQSAKRLQNYLSKIIFCIILLDVSLGCIASVSKGLFNLIFF